MDVVDEDSIHEQERSPDHFLSDHDLKTLDPFRLVATIFNERGVAALVLLVASDSRVYVGCMLHLLMSNSGATSKCNYNGFL